MRYHAPRATNAAADSDARRLTLTTAVKDAAAGRLSAREIAEAVHVARVGREKFDALVDAERIRQAGERETRDREDEGRRRKLASVKPLNDLGGGWDRQ
jgi:hypothetical protein